jgi:hypothetical protein
MINLFDSGLVAKTEKNTLYFSNVNNISGEQIQDDALKRTYNVHSIHEAKIERLIDIDFVWESSKMKWMEIYQQRPAKTRGVQEKVPIDILFPRSMTKVSSFGA